MEKLWDFLIVSISFADFITPLAGFYLFTVITFKIPPWDANVLFYSLRGQMLFVS